MQRQSCIGPAFDFSILEDELEQHRIQLENNLQETDLSLHLSSVPGDNIALDNPSVEYPRHRSGPIVAELPSFAYSAGDHIDSEAFNHSVAWSYCTVDGEDGIHPYAGETISTAAHHASALTLSAGLAGRVAASFSETEYDPERPLQRIISPADRNKDGKGCKSPRVTTKLDHVLRLGHSFPPPPPSICIKAPQSSLDISTPDVSGVFRPKFSDALRRVSFSPNRPRNSPSSYPHTGQCLQLPDHINVPRYFAQPPPLSSSCPPHTDADATASKPGISRNLRNDRISFQPDVPLRDPPPLPTSSPGLKMVESTPEKLVRKDLGDLFTNHKTKHSKTISRRPFNDVVNHSRLHVDTSHRRPYTSHRPMRGPRLNNKGRVQLPDVTGLTSAIASPPKPVMKHHQYYANNEFRESDARLISTFNAVQSKLSHLEAENSISRRRVQELELELLTCKRDAAKEQSSPENKYDGLNRLSKTSASKGSAKQVRDSGDENQALEDLITTLRAHLARLTKELSSHHQLLNKLQSYQECDSHALKSKFREVDTLSKEVERLAGEVGVLRGMVEEGLRERQQVRDQRPISQASSNDSRFEQQQNAPIPAGYEPPENMPGTSGNLTHNSQSSQAENDKSLSGPAKQVATDEPSDDRHDRAHGPAVLTQHVSTNTQQPSIPRPKTPQIRGGRLERLFLSVPEHHPATCKLCEPCRQSPSVRTKSAFCWTGIREILKTPAADLQTGEEDEGFVEGSCEEVDQKRDSREGQGADPKGKRPEHSGSEIGHRPSKEPRYMVLIKVVRELEDDFAHYKSIYVELANGYKAMDAVSDPPRRNLLARHLREVIGLLEQRGDQIASLYDLLKSREMTVSRSTMLDTACNG